MISLLLAIIYLAFISLGLPDSLLGSAWPVMHLELGVSNSVAGVVTMIIYCGTVTSSLLSDRLTHKLGAGKVTAISVLLTAVSLFGFSICSRFWMICLWAIPYGLGAGAVDAALNNYVALHYSSRQMSWLHCCWGVGASISPYIMGQALASGSGWQAGYRNVGLIQIVLSFVIFASLPLWKKAPALKNADAASQKTEDHEPIPIRKVIRIPGAIFVFLMFFAYCAMEQTTILWASTYMTSAKAVPVADAARFGSLFTLGIMFGRLISGFISNRLGDRKMIRLGIIIAGVGILMIALPIKGVAFAIAGLVVLGLGCAPIYPSIIHATPDNFGADKSQAVVGMQMASAYIGTTTMATLFGPVSNLFGIAVMPFYLLFFYVLMAVMFFCLNRTVDRVNHRS